MSGKRVIKNHHIIVAGDMDADIISNVIEADALDIISIEASWSGTSPVGSLRIEGSITGENWQLLGTALSVSGSPGSGFATSANDSGFSTGINAFPKVRVFYDETSGSGTLDVWLCAKEN